MCNFASEALEVGANLLPLEANLYVLIFFAIGMISNEPMYCGLNFPFFPKLTIPFVR